MALNLNNIMLGSEDSKKLADFYAKVLGARTPNGATKLTDGSASRPAMAAWPSDPTAT
jgi:catechol-2,3-dioxygenase